ncbi:type VI secretion system tip protein VgrG [Myxococcus stipitatus]|uniref:type VI secretion system tip protein TssI/VgrG n=1 Tax=Myxococcus stipitatus TaxID=83455 RepID=UPI003145222F
MPRRPHTLLELQAEGFTPGELVAVRMSGEEALSEPYDFRVEFFPRSLEPLDVKALLGTEATLLLHGPDGGDRFVHGVVDEARDLGDRHGRPEYRLRLVPRLRLLRNTRRSRIFQHLSVPDIVKKVLSAANVKLRLALSSSYAPREFCVQYRESDLDFVRRLLESEGICFFFEHEESSHTMVLGDGAGAHAPISGDARVVFRGKEAHVAEAEHVSSVTRTQRLRPGTVSLRDFDFERPTLDLTSKTRNDPESLGWEVYDYPGDYVKPAEGQSLSRVRLEALRFGTKTLAGDGTCHRLVPGATFELAEHPEGDLNGEVLVVRVRHEGRRQEVVGDVDALEESYRNHFVALPSGVPYRPRLATPVPHILGIQTATVVGPSSEETQPDTHGRIKVQFHWDRDGKSDDKSSCWVRAGQAWAGAAWGADFIPRVGQEAVVRFLEGNPDKPLLVGAVYNGQNAPPLALPGEKTKSTVRTDSSPGGGGFNEVRIEDSAGSEEVFLHAQKDENLDTLNDKSQRVGGNESLLVEKDRARDIVGKQALTVKLDDASTVEGSQSLRVALNRETRTKGDHSEEVERNQSITVMAVHALNVKLAAATSVGAAAALGVGGGYGINVGGATNIAVLGARAETVGGKRSESVAGSRTEMVEGAKTSRVLGDVTEEVEGGLSQMAEKGRQDDIGKNHLSEVKGPMATGAKKLQLKSDEMAVVVNSELALLINKSGTVKLFAKTLTVDGKNIKLKGKKIKKDGSGSGKRKPFKEVLDESVAETMREYGPEGGPLSPADAKAFTEGKYTMKVLKKDVTVHRLFGGESGAQGRWVTAGPRPTGLEGKIRMALRPEWGNTATQSASMTLKAGTVLYEGGVAGQGLGYSGGATQILIKTPPQGAGEFLKAVFL